MPPVASTSSNVFYYDPKYEVTLDGLTRTLKIKHFGHSPFTRTISLDSLHWIRPARDIITNLRGYDNCGYSINSKVQWARDRERSDARRGGEKGERAIDRCIVLKKDHWAAEKTGFSVEDPRALMDALEKIKRGITTRDPSSDRKTYRRGDLVRSELTGWNSK
jgi:hypothetical protein